MDDHRGERSSERRVHLRDAAALLGVSARMLVVAERHGAHTQAWLAAATFGLWSALAVVCFFWGEA